MRNATQLWGLLVDLGISNAAVSFPPHTDCVPDLRLCSGGTDTWSDSVSSCAQNHHNPEVSTLQINVAEHGFCSREKKDQDTERPVRPMLSKRKKTSSSILGKSMAEEMGVTVAGWGLQGQGASGQITYLTMKKEEGG